MRLKTCFKGIMNHGRLNGLALLDIHHFMESDDSTIVSELAQTHPRRMESVDMKDDTKEY